MRDHDIRGLNIGGFIAEHREHRVIRGCGSGFGWSAQRRNDHRRPAGPLLESLSLDELDEKIRAAEDWSIGERSSPAG